MIENGHLKQIQLLVRNRMFLSDSNSFFLVFCTLLYLYYNFQLFLAKSPNNSYFVIIARLFFFLAIKKVFKFLFQIKCVYVSWVCMWMWIYMIVEARGVRSPELVLPVVVSHQMRMLGNELRSSANPVLVLNYSVISPTLFYFCILLNCF